jgi:alcohol dehydrogenase class IV
MQKILLPSTIEIGGGAAGAAGDHIRQLNVLHPLIVTDAVLHKLGAAEKLRTCLQIAGYSSVPVFSDTIPEPTTDAVDCLVRAVSTGGHDCLLALGGGSVIDTAKAASVLAVHGGHMRDYKAPRNTSDAGIPVIAIPTTAGTGSEVTKFTVISDSLTGEKMLCTGSAFLPRVALVDYELTLTKPMRITADTGLDALTHAVEAYVSKKAGPFTDGIALSSMATIYANIRRVCANPQDRAAREAMMCAATEAGIAFSNSSVALVHGMSRPIGAHFHVPHGLSNAMLLPMVTAFSASAAMSRYATCARTMGISAATDNKQAVADLVAALVQLNADLAVPSLKQFGIEGDQFEDMIPTMVDQALASGSPANNPRVPTPAELAKLYRDVWNEISPLQA